METLCLKLLNMSIAAGWMILAVILLRVVLKKARTTMRCLLWAMVGVRLLIPFVPESALSLIPSAETVPLRITSAWRPIIDSGITPINQAVNPVIARTFFPSVDHGIGLMGQVVEILTWIWAAGAATLLVYAAIRFFHVRRQVRAAIELEPGIWICDHVNSPFILGLLRPRIYLPSSTEPQWLEHIMAHERSHIRCRDHLWKPLAFLILALHWYNPLVWLSYVLLCRDLELACDERVIRAIGPHSRKAYSETLLLCSVPRRTIGMCPLAFGEVGVKDRIKSILRYRWPASWLRKLSGVLCILMAVCFVTNPKTDMVGDDYYPQGAYEMPFKGALPQYTEDNLPLLDLDIQQDRYTVNGTAYHRAQTPTGRELTSTSYGWSVDRRMLDPVGKTADGSILFALEGSDAFFLLAEQGENLTWLVRQGSTLLAPPDQLRLEEYYVYLNYHVLEDPAGIENLWAQHTTQTPAVSAAVTYKAQSPRYIFEDYQCITLVSKECPALYYILRYTTYMTARVSSSDDIHVFENYYTKQICYLPRS